MGSEVRARALALLSRREHSVSELQQKLAARGLNSDAITLTLAQLEAEGLQSDRRFTESYMHSRQLKGYGPRHVSQGLRERGVAVEIIELVLASSDVDWFVLAVEVREKKFGPDRPADYKTQMKQSSFLNYRGFTGEQIRAALNTDDQR